LSVTGLWFSPGTPVSSTNRTDSHDITEILLKVALNTIKQTNKYFFVIWCHGSSFQMEANKNNYANLPIQHTLPIKCLFPHFKAIFHHWGLPIVMWQVLYLVVQIILKWSFRNSSDLGVSLTLIVIQKIRGMLLNDSFMFEIKQI
jgi:hypothetical protein